MNYGDAEIARFIREYGPNGTTRINGPLRSSAEFRAGGKSHGFASHGGVNLIALSEVEPEELQWLWSGRIPFGKVTLCVGDPGGGKSLLSLAIAAAVSRGDKLPDSDACQIGRIIVANFEDGLRDTIRVRAGSVGCDLSRVEVINGSTNESGDRIPFTLNHVEELKRKIFERGDVRLLIVDPVAALLSETDSHRDSEVRGALQCLVDLAEQTGVAILVVMHLRKTSADRAIYRVGGSIAFTGLARSVLLVARDECSGRRAIVSIKSNLAVAPDPVEFAIDDSGKVVFFGLAPDLRADRLLAPAPSEAERTASGDARAAILESLEVDQLSADQLRARVRNFGVSDISFRRARSDLHAEGVIARRGGGAAGPIFWSLASTIESQDLY